MNPTLTAASIYPSLVPGGPFAEEIATAKSIFEAELAAKEGWKGACDSSSSLHALMRKIDLNRQTKGFEMMCI